MLVTVNGKCQEIPEQASIEDLLSQLSAGAGRIAVELNGEIVPRSSFSSQSLAAGDEIEIVQAIGGG